jgi:hypothetical protein
MKYGKAVRRERPLDARVLKRAWVKVGSREEDSSVCLRRGEEIDDHVDG